MHVQHCALCYEVEKMGTDLNFKKLARQRVCIFKALFKVYDLKHLIKITNKIEIWGVMEVNFKDIL